MEQFRIGYQFVGGTCPHHHATSQNNRSFEQEWELCTICFEAHDWFSGPVNRWIKNECAALGIAWLEFAPKSKPTPLIHMLAEQAGMVALDVPNTEHQRSLGMWAALEQGGSIFEDEYCSTPWCENHDPLKALFARKIDVVVHAPVVLVERLLSDLYDWNRGASK